MNTKFEEKTYESYFNTELAKLSKVYFALGQVQEGDLGFDCSVFTTNRKLWAKLGSKPLKGSELMDVAKHMEDILNLEIKNIPSMKTNMLLQYKKPQYLTSSKAGEWYEWCQPYYRYDIYKKQHDLLISIYEEFNKEVLIIYASPALYDTNELVDAYINQKVIEYSNFKEAYELTGHHRNTYIKSGTHSIACSEVEMIKNIDIIKLIEEGYRDVKKKDDDNIGFILNFTKKIISITYENEYYSNPFKRLNDTISEFKDYKLLYSFLVMKNFKEITGTQWILNL